MIEIYIHSCKKNFCGFEIRNHNDIPPVKCIDCGSEEIETSPLRKSSFKAKNRRNERKPVRGVTRKVVNG